MLFGGGDHIGVFDRATGLNNGADSCCCGQRDRIWKRKEGIGCEHATASSLAGFLQRDPDRINAAHLSRADSVEAAISRNGDCIGFDVSHNGPAEQQLIEQLLVGWITGDQLPFFGSGWKVVAGLG